MRKPKANRWSDYKSAQTSDVADLDFVQSHSKLRFEVQGGRVQSLEYSFMKERPQIASLFAKVLLVEGGRYKPRRRVAIIGSVRVFNQFIEHWRPDINHTLLITYELLQEFAVWMINVRKFYGPTAANLFSGLRVLLRAAKSLYRGAFQPDFDIPNYTFSKPNSKRPASWTCSEEVLRQLVAAAEREVGQIRKNYREGEVLEGIGQLIPFMILIAVKTAINPHSLYTIKRDCLKPHVIDTSAFYVVWTKWRSKTGVQQQLHYTDRRGQGVVELLQFLITYTQPLIAQVERQDQDKLFLYRYCNGSSKDGGWRVAVARRSDRNNQALIAFCRRNQLPDIKMAQLRPSAATHYYRKTGGKLRKVQLLLGHAEMSTTVRYIGNSLVQSLHNNSIRAAQDALLMRAATVIPKKAKQALVDLTDNLTTKHLEKIADGVYDTSICKCRDPFDSPQPGQRKGKCCTLFLACLTCPNALFFLEDLPRVIALRDHLLAEKETMRLGVWEVLYQDNIKIIEDDIIGAFSDVQIAEAELLARNITDVSVLTAKGILK